jgi:hypothetical protein
MNGGHDEEAVTSTRSHASYDAVAFLAAASGTLEPGSPAPRAAPLHRYGDRIGIRTHDNAG